MKKFIKNRVLPIVCALSILISLCVVPTYAWDVSTDILDTETPAQWEFYVSDLGAFNAIGLALSIGLNVGFSAVDVFWGVVDTIVSQNGDGAVSLSKLNSICAAYNTLFNRPIGETPLVAIFNDTREMGAYVVSNELLGFIPSFAVTTDPKTGNYRIYCPETQLFVVSSSGRYPYTPADSAASAGGNKWVGERSCSTSRVVMQDAATLGALNAMLIESGYSSQLRQLGNYIAIWCDHMYYCDPHGYPFVCWADDKQSATTQPRPDTSVLDQDGNPVEDVTPGNQTNIDLSGMTIMLPTGDINMIDTLYYDEADKTYYIDASQTTYEGDKYYTFNFSYEWTYHINYTSITYIGQTAEYDKYYEVYYELPDGRDSADLSREDLEQLNLSIDVLPYSRAVDNVSLKSLYHFDGDTRDSSYWNYRTEFDWNKGASITYMDAGVFNGALYLDETEHDFTFTLPFFIGSDFTMQWRYYQSATAAPQTDSYLKLGNTVVLRFDGAQIRDRLGIPICDMPVGTWNELCLTATDGMLHLYLNGVSVASWVSFGYYSYFVNFHFGSEQQTFKYFDEFRFLSEDIYNDGADYTPTSVPHDTNLTLVLPDSDQIVADEWISWTPGKDTLAVIDFTNGADSNLPGIHMFDGYREYEVPSGPNGETQSITSKVADFSCSFEFTEQGLLITREEGSSGVVDAGASGLCIDLAELLPAEAYSSYISYRIFFNNSSLPSLGSYLYGIYDSSTSEWMFSRMHRETASNADFCPTSLMGPSSASTSFTPYYLDGDYILYPVSGSICISRIEFVYTPGGSYQSDWSKPTVHRTVSAIDSSTIKVPSLAVRTDLKVTDYQIGGMRPSVPKKGLVWAMVENQRIVSIQIYNGSAWEACEGRIWTGKRWVPAGAYNVITLQDMYDIVDSTQDYEYIYTETGFWAWWQKSWNSFTDRLFSVLDKIAASSGVIDDEDMPTGEDDGGEWQFLDLLVVLRDGTWNIISGVVSVVFDGLTGLVSVVDDAGNFFVMFDADSENYLFQVSAEEGASIWD